MDYKDYIRILKISNITETPLTGQALEIHNRVKEILDDLYMEKACNSYDIYFTYDGSPLFNVDRSDETIGIGVPGQNSYKLCINYVVANQIFDVNKFKIKKNRFLFLLYGMIEMESKEKYNPKKPIK